MDLDVILSHFQRKFKQLPGNIHTFLEYRIFSELIAAEDNYLHATVLASRVGKVPNGFARALNKLVEEKFITRVVDENDGRSIRIYIVDEKKEEIQKYVLKTRTDINAIFTNMFLTQLSEGDLAKLMIHIQRVAHKLPE